MKWGYAVVQLVEGRGFDSRWGHWNFSLTLSFLPHHNRGVNSASNRNEYQGYLEILGASNSWSLEGLSRTIMG